MTAFILRRLPSAAPLLNPWVLVGVLAYTIVVATFCGWQGYQLGENELYKYQAKQATVALKVRQKRDEATEKVVTKYVQVAGETKTVTEYIEKKVVEYANTGYCLDPAWRVYHDLAAGNIVPKPGFIPDAAGGTAPTAAAALQTVTESYAACHRTADRLDALQDWVRKQQAVTP